MKLAVSSRGPDLDDKMEARFGRCPYFVFIDPDTMAFEAIENPNIALSWGAGIQSAQLMAEKGATVVLTGNCGPNAFQVFGAAGIEVITGVDGTVREAVGRYKGGSLNHAAAPSVDAHFGMGDAGQTGAGTSLPNSGMPGGTGGGQVGAGMGMGAGMGRGMGRGGGGGKGCGMGRGMGMGGGMGRGMGMMGSGGGMASPAAPVQTGNSREEEMKLLKQSAEDLRRQLDSIESKIKEITKERHGSSQKSG